MTQSIETPSLAVLEDENLAPGIAPFQGERQALLHPKTNEYLLQKCQKTIYHIPYHLQKCPKTKISLCLEDDMFFYFGEGQLQLSLKKGGCFFKGLISKDGIWRVFLWDP